MNPDMFTPTLDWGNEWWTSLIWIAKAWAIAAVCTLVVLVLIARYTTWGRQFWRITGDYFTGRQSIPVWALLGVLLASVVLPAPPATEIPFFRSEASSARAANSGCARSPRLSCRTWSFQVVSL